MQNSFFHFFLVFFLFLNTMGYAQTPPKLKDPSNQFIIDKVIDYNVNAGVLYFGRNNPLGPNEIFSTYLEYTGLGEDDVMTLDLISYDSLIADTGETMPNLEHDVYNQYYKGVLVEGGHYTINHDQTYVWYASGQIVEGLSLNVTPTVLESSALATAMAAVCIGDFSWTTITNEPPVGVLVLTPNGAEGSVTPSDFVLAWRFEIFDDGLNYTSFVYVNAISGAFMKQLSRAADGNFYHLYYGNNNTIDTHWYRNWGVDHYYLHANDPGHNIMTTDHDGVSNDNSVWQWDFMPESRGGNLWGSDNQVATSAHFSATNATDFFQSNYNRNGGLSGWGDVLRVASNQSNGSASQYIWINNHDFIRLSNYQGSACVTLDILGHEYMHGIDQHTAHPLYGQNEAGAIEEGFCDIMGFMAERYYYGYIPDWTIAEDLGSGKTWRNMSAPSSLAFQLSTSGCGYPSYYPNYYYGPNYYTGSCDLGGVHINCTVVDKWFYLLAQGGNTTIGGVTTYVTGIGADKAAKIVYYTSTSNTMSSTENFYQYRDHTLASARALYGICSQAYLSTCAAWKAVNVGPACIPCAITWRGRKSNAVPEQEVNDNLIDFKLFPNPANDKIYLNVEIVNRIDGQKYFVNVMDATGRLVLTRTTSDLRNFTIETADFASGIYFVNFGSDNWTKTSKFIKN